MQLGIDLGGTKIEAIAMQADGRIRCRQRLPTPGNDYRAIIAALVALVASVETDAGPCASIGVGTPGSVSLGDGSMKNCNTTCLNGRFLQRDLEEALGRPVRIANDADCFALSESVDGVAVGAATVFGVILGTGVGGGVVVNGRLLSGPNAIGSEWGHNVLPGVGTLFEDQQRRCYCGNLNCVETYLSGPGFCRTYVQIGGAESGGPELDAQAIVGRAAEGDVLAQQALDSYHRQLAYALSQVINLIDPHVIVLGGGMSNIQSLYSSVPALWKGAIFSDTIATRLLPARFGDSSGVRGAARLWNDGVW